MYFRLEWRDLYLGLGLEEIQAATIVLLRWIRSVCRCRRPAKYVSPSDRCSMPTWVSPRETAQQPQPMSKFPGLDSPSQVFFCDRMPRDLLP